MPRKKKKQFKNTYIPGLDDEEDKEILERDENDEIIDIQPIETPIVEETSNFSLTTPHDTLYLLTNKLINIVNSLEIQINNQLRTQQEANPIYYELLRKFAKDISANITKLELMWEKIEKNQVNELNEQTIQAYSNINKIIQFFVIKQPDLLDEFLNWMEIKSD